MSLFQQRKNKRFNYTPRHLQEEGRDLKENLESKWRGSSNTSKKGGKSLLGLLAFILSMVIVVYLVLDYYKK